MKRPRKVLLVAGARPNFMKLAPLYHRMREDKRFEARICHTGQHFDAKMSDIFWNNLELPVPDHLLDVRASGVAETIGATAIQVSALLRDYPVDDVVVFGDVSSTAGAAIAAAHSQSRLIHIEAGLRSFDRDMPEELNRITVDHLSDLLFVSEESGMTNLAKEGIVAGRFHLVGNLMIECMINTREKWQGTQQHTGEAFGVCTFHRPENVDRDDVLSILVDRIRKTSDFMTLVWPLHPRTRMRLEATGLMRAMRNMPRVKLRDPLGYFEFLGLVHSSAMVLTDSGGIQEETSFMGKPCITVRSSTERPITLTKGTNKLVSLTSPNFVGQICEHYEAVVGGGDTSIPLWDDKVSKRIAGIMVL